MNKNKEIKKFIKQNSIYGKTYQSLEILNAVSILIVLIGIAFGYYGTGIYTYIGFIGISIGFISSFIAHQTLSQMRSDFNKLFLKMGG